MRYRKVTDDGDYTFGGGQNDYFRDVPEAVGLACASRLRLWLGEWFLDIEEGTLYLQGVLGKKTKTQADETIQTRALGTQGLTGIPEYESVIDPDTRNMSVEFQIDTIYGPTSVQLENYANY
jgi:hypothetical protein